MFSNKWRTFIIFFACIVIIERKIIMNKILLLIVCLVTFTCAYADIEVTVTNEAELINAINMSNGNPNEMYDILISIDTVINGEPTLTITQKLPTMVGQLTIAVDDDTDILPNTSYLGPLFTVGSGGKLILDGLDMNIQMFHNTDDGGSIVVEGNGVFTTSQAEFLNSVSDQNGGVLSCDGVCDVSFTTFNSSSSVKSGGAIKCGAQGECNVSDSSFINNSAGTSGGAAICQGQCQFYRIALDGNSAGTFACSVDAPFGARLTIDQCTIRDRGNRCSTNSFDVNGGDMLHSNCYVEINPVDFSSCTGSCSQQGNYYISITPSKTSNKTTCNDFGTGAFTSLGYNLDSSDGCFLDHVTDIENTDPDITMDNNNIPIPNSNSPLIESGSNEFSNNALPCSFKDMNGLGRPQDFDGDGVFTCDRGPIEVQGGMDLSNAQSGLYFDVDRDGEGIILEMLGNGKALVTMFTYHPNKSDLMWFVGAGDVVGNSVVIDNVQRTSGGVFGPDFDADAIVRTDVGGMSLIFPDCDSTSNPGRLVFEAGFGFTEELENLLVKNNRISRLLECNQSQTNPMIGRSGIFSDPNRSGEGVFVQVLNSGQVVIVFYTYTPDGKQFWYLGSNGQINGNTITADMKYPAQTTGFGSQFNSNEIDLQPWGTISMVYQPGCNNITINYNSIIAGFGNGSYSYQRLTRPAGTTCDL